MLVRNKRRRASTFIKFHGCHTQMEAQTTHIRFVQTCADLAAHIQGLDKQVAHLLQLKRCLSDNKDFFVEADSEAVSQRVEALRTEADAQRRTLQQRIDRYEREVQAVQRCLEGRRAALQSCSAAHDDEVMQQYFNEGQERMQMVVDAALLHLLPDSEEAQRTPCATASPASIARAPPASPSVLTVPSPCNSDHADQAVSGADCVDDAEASSAAEGARA